MDRLAASPAAPATAAPDPFLRLGRFVARHPWAVLFSWLVAIALGAVGAHRLGQVTVGVEGGVPGSPSYRANEVLRRDFGNPYIDPVVVAVSAPQLKVDATPYLQWVQRAAATLSALHGVRKVASYADERSAHLRSADGHVTMLLAGLEATDISGRQQGVIAVRTALAPLAAVLRQSDPGARVAVTGGAAADLDVNTWSAAGGDHAEKRALPLTLAILVVAFGTLLAASLPFLTGLSTTTIALGLAYLLALLMPVSNLLGNVVTMIGLAIGIDYSLLTVTHYREHAPGASVADSVAATVALAGRTISWSGLTVIIGLLGLLFSPLLETRSVGIGGALVVCVSVLAALTLLPAALVLLGPRIDWLPVMPRRGGRQRLLAFWRALGGWVVRHPFVTLLLAGGCVLALAAPILRANSGFSNERWFLPRATESRAGLEILRAVRSENAALTIYIIVRTTDGSPLLAAAHLPALVAYGQTLAADPRVAEVNSPVNLDKGLGLDAYQGLYDDWQQALLEHPPIAELYLSHDRRAGLFEVTPAERLDARAIGQLTQQLAARTPAGPYSVIVGGAPAEHNDFNDYMFRSLPRIFGFVVCTTLLLLYAAFRSYLLPVKAVLMNLLAVAAGIGAVVAVFQLGWLNWLVGLEHPFSAIPLEIPLMVFCLSFGLSMDYELFLLFRIQSEYRRDLDNNRATVEGLAAVAPVITGAGLIMVVVFGAFVGAELPVLKMTGVGLCVAVLVDATLIRALLVPAVMAIAGRWNWYPGPAAGPAP
jgi:RND superfamily putative drug exporter